MEKHHLAETALKKVEGWFSIEMDEEVVAETCICLIEVLLYRFDHRLNEGLLNVLLRTAQAVRDPYLMARANQSLCRAATMRGEGERAIEYGRSALGFFASIQDKDAIFRGALTLAKAYRVSHEYTLAKRQLDTALTHIGEHIPVKEQGDLHFEIGVVAYEHGVISEDSSLFDTATVHLQTATTLYAQTDTPYRHAALYHMQGLLLMRMGRLDEAREILELAQESWAKLGNPYESVNIRYARSFVEAKRGNLDLARELVEEALEMMGDFPDIPAYDELHAELQQHARNLHTGVYRKAETE